MTCAVQSAVESGTADAPAAELLGSGYNRVRLPGRVHHGRGLSTDAEAVRRRILSFATRCRRGLLSDAIDCRYRTTLGSAAGPSNHRTLPAGDRFVDTPANSRDARECSMNPERALILPIATYIPLADPKADRYLRALSASTPRLVKLPGCSVDGRRCRIGRRRRHGKLPDAKSSIEVSSLFISGSICPR